MATTVNYRFRVRRRTTANWIALNEVLLDSEIGLESDLKRRSKIGDGVTGWNSLPFYTAGLIDQTALSTIADGDVLAWDATAGMFVPASISADVPFAVATGTDTITATFSPAPTLVDGLQLSVRAAAANTGAATFNPNSLGALAITKTGGTALAAGDIAAAGHELILRYRASPARYELLNPAAASGGGSTSDSRDSWLFG